MEFPPFIRSVHRAEHPRVHAVREKLRCLKPVRAELPPDRLRRDVHTVAVVVQVLQVAPAECLERLDLVVFGVAREMRVVGGDNRDPRAPCVPHRGITERTGTVDVNDVGVKRGELRFEVLLAREGEPVVPVQREPDRRDFKHRHRLRAGRRDYRREEYALYPLLHERIDQPVEHARHTVVPRPHCPRKVRHTQPGMTGPDVHWRSSLYVQGVPFNWFHRACRSPWVRNSATKRRTQSVK